MSHKGLSPVGEFSKQAFNYKAYMLDLAGRRCADAGLTLAYHNHQPEFWNHASEEMGLLGLTDAKLVFLMLDIGHAWRVDPNYIGIRIAPPARFWAARARFSQSDIGSAWTGRVSLA